MEVGVARGVPVATAVADGAGDVLIEAEVADAVGFAVPATVP